VVLSVLVPAADLHPSQLRALELFRQADHDDEATIRAIGHASLAAQTPPTRVIRRNVSLIVGRGHWPSPSLHITCADAYTGERCVLTHRTGVGTPAAIAASSAVPGLFRPQLILDRRCMDGGVSGSGTHLDLLAAATRVLVLTLVDGTVEAGGMMTSPPGAFRREVDQVERSGTKVFLRAPSEVDMDELMSPSAVDKALAMGERQALDDAGELTDFWR
jgi:hypothetical protein